MFDDEASYLHAWFDNEERAAIEADLSLVVHNPSLSTPQQQLCAAITKLLEHFIQPANRQAGGQVYSNSVLQNALMAHCATSVPTFVAQRDALQQAYNGRFHATGGGAQRPLLTPATPHGGNAPPGHAPPGSTLALVQAHRQAEQQARCAAHGPDTPAHAEVEYGAMQPLSPRRNREIFVATQCTVVALLALAQVSLDAHRSAAMAARPEVMAQLHNCAPWRQDHPDSVNGLGWTNPITQAPDLFHAEMLDLTHRPRDNAATGDLWSDLYHHMTFRYLMGCMFTLVVMSFRCIRGQIVRAMSCDDN